MNSPRIVILGIADFISSEIDLPNYNDLNIYEKSRYLSKKSFYKLLDYLSFSEDSSENCITDLISIPPSGIFSDFGHSIKLAFELGLTGISTHTIDNEGASVGSAIEQGSRIIKDNDDRVVLISAGDAAKSITRSASDMQYVTLTTTHKDSEVPYGATLISLYALLGQRLFYENQITSKEIGEIIHYFRSCAIQNPRAVNFQKELKQRTLDRMIASPYSIPMIAVISDHAFSTILMSERKWKELTDKKILKSPSPPVYITGYSTAIYSEYVSQRKHFESPSIKSGRDALSMSSLEPYNIDYAWIYDCFPGILLKQISNFFDLSPYEVTQTLKSGYVLVNGKKIYINRGGGILNYQASMSISGATGLMDVLSQFSLTPNPLFDPRNERPVNFALMSNNGGIDSINSVVIFSRNPDAIHKNFPDQDTKKIPNKVWFPLNLPLPEKIEHIGILYSYTIIYYNPGGNIKPPYNLVCVKLPDDRLIFCNLYDSEENMIISDKELIQDETKVLLKYQDKKWKGYIID